MPDRVIVMRVEAVGGPAASSEDSQGFEQGPTNAGTYAIAYCGQHSSRRYPAWSSVPWGSQLRKELTGTLSVMVEGRWRPLSDFTTVTETDIIAYNYQLYGDAKLPATWIFNDFGHVTCYYFKDLNDDGKLNPSRESIEGEFIHTTPVDEAMAARGQPVILTESHGCIHVKPADIDSMIAKDYLKKGNPMVVHGYTDPLPAYPTDANGKPPFEVHFYPGSKTMLILGRP